MLELEIARRAAQAGGEVVARSFREGTAIRQKADHALDEPIKTYNLVTDADVESEQAIVGVIRRAFSDHAVLGEEEHRGDIECEHLWVIDPLDGTNNFVHGIPHFAISVAYYHRGSAVCGFVTNPIRDDWYEAARGQGARSHAGPLRVADHARLDEVLVGVGFYYDRGQMMEATLRAIRDLFHRNIHGIRRFGTASLDLVQVASGVFGAFFEYELSPWEFAAGRLIVEEAGGRITTCAGDPLPLSKSSVMATNGRLHEAMLEIVQAHLPTS